LIQPFGVVLYNNHPSVLSITILHTHTMATQLPPSLDLPPHLSAHKYFFVCTLTVAAWDTLVLSPRSWRMVKLKDGWPVLKILYNFLRIFMPIEFIVVGMLIHPLFPYRPSKLIFPQGVAFFDTKFTQNVGLSFMVVTSLTSVHLVYSAMSKILSLRAHLHGRSSRCYFRYDYDYKNFPLYLQTHIGCLPSPSSRSRYPYPRNL
jgi:hypothetical protein